MVSYDGAELADINVSLLPSGDGYRCRWSSSIELRWASLAECREAFFEIASSAREFEAEQFLCHRLTQCCVLAVVDGLLRQSQRHRRPRGQPDQQLFADAVHISRRHWLVNQPPVRGVSRADFVAEQQHLLGTCQPDQSGK